MSYWDRAEGVYILLENYQAITGIIILTKLWFNQHFSLNLRALDLPQNTAIHSVNAGVDNSVGTKA